MNRYSEGDLSTAVHAAWAHMKRRGIDALVGRVERWATGRTIPQSKNASEASHRELLALREATRAYVETSVLDIGVGTLYKTPGFLFVPLLVACWFAFRHSKVRGGELPVPMYPVEKDRAE